MCILCVIQKWSRRIATMLPRLVIPLIGLWALSQLLPPPFRFEITSSRLACLFVLLVTLFWYEVLMPRLSVWRVSRNARLREKKRFEAIEMQKLINTATRRCRNCYTAYREQNPSGGKFMCCYCGHISKRPVLDFKDVVGRGGNGWIWEQGLFGGADKHCLTDKSYSRFFIFARKILTVFLLSVTWLWRKVFRDSSSTSADAEHSGMLDNRGGNGQESRGEKARRKAEEKKQARLEKELLEEEEKKQREEVARLVEEQRRLRDEKMLAEKEHLAKEKGSRKESEKRRNKEKDRGSSKSTSDVEELENRTGKEGDQNKKTHRSGGESMKAHATELGHGFKGNHNRANATRYLDRMKGTLLSSSRAITGSGFFGNTTNSSTLSRDHKPVENTQTSYRKEIVQPDHVSTRSNVNGDDKISKLPVAFIEPQVSTAPKKSWQQLFTRSSADSSPSNANVISRPIGTCKLDVQSPPSAQSFDNPPMGFGLSTPLPLGSSNSCTSLPGSNEAGSLQDSEIFEDPCYVPDAIALLGPVSESLDSFHDLGFVNDMELKTKAAPSEVTKPSPIECPLSRSRVLEDNGKSANDNGTWQMWNSSPLVQDGLGLVGSASWLLHPNRERQVPHKTMASLFKKDEQIPRHDYMGNSHIGDSIWLPRPLFGPTPEKQAMLKPNEEVVQNGHVYGISGLSTANHQFELSGAKKEWSVPGTQICKNHHIGGLYSSPDIESLWSMSRD